jgi:hypothetical protein
LRLVGLAVFQGVDPVEMGGDFLCRGSFIQHICAADGNGRGCEGRGLVEVGEESSTEIDDGRRREDGDAGKGRDVLGGVRKGANVVNRRVREENGIEGVGVLRYCCEGGARELLVPSNVDEDFDAAVQFEEGAGG